MFTFLSFLSDLSKNGKVNFIHIFEKYYIIFLKKHDPELHTGLCLFLEKETMNLFTLSPEQQQKYSQV